MSQDLELTDAGRALTSPAPSDDGGSDLSSTKQRLEAFVEKHAAAPERPQKAPVPHQTPEALRDFDQRAHAQGAALRRESDDIRAQAAAVQRELAAVRTLEVVDPNAARARQIELGHVVVALQQREAQHQAAWVQFDEACLDATGYALWGNDAARMQAEMQPLMEWAMRERGMNPNDVARLARQPAQALMVYDAWRASIGQPVTRRAPPVKAVPRPDGKPAVKPVPVSYRRTGGANRDLDAEAGAALIRGLRR